MHAMLRSSMRCIPKKVLSDSDIPHPAPNRTRYALSMFSDLPHPFFSLGRSNLGMALGCMEGKRNRMFDSGSL